MSTTMTSLAESPVRRAREHDAVPPLGSWDWWLLGTVVLQMAFGILMILSASSLFADARYGNSLHFAIRQLAGLGMGATLGFVLIRQPWSRLRALAWPVFGVALFGLLLVLTPLSHSANGATRWISLGGINFQPSEFGKLALIFVLSHYLSCNEGRLNDFFGVVIPAMAVPFPLLLLVMLQPDFGTTVILAGLCGLLLFLAGLRWSWVGALGGTGLAALGVVAVLAPYRVRRMTSFLDPFADSEGAGYQVVQGWIALASGGISGRGLATGLAQSGFLPEAHTDFIAAVVGEEFGAVGWAVLVLSYAVIVWRGTVIADRSTDLFGTLLAMGITVLLAMQAIINLGVVVGWLPAKGLVLPFLSYGSSAALVHTLAIALLLRVSMQPAVAAQKGAHST